MIKNLLFIFIVAFYLSLPHAGFGQAIPSGGMDGDVNRIEGKFKFIPLPYLNYNRSIGFTLGAIPMAMFNPVEKDTISPSSIGGLFGMYTTNKTWFTMGFAALFLDEDNWRIMGAGGIGSVNFQFYLDNPIDIWIPYNTQADFFFLQVKRRVVNKFYFGISYMYTKYNTTTDVFPDTTLTRLHGLGFELSLDKRVGFYYPRSGYQANIKYFTYPGAFGNEYVSNKIEFDYDHYFPFRNNKDVLAGRLYGGLGIGDLSFNQQFIVGQTDIRGYTQGAYRGNYLLALQGEYRWNFHKRLGAVGFLGLATIFESINEDDNGRILPGIGTGIRYTVIQDTHMNVGLDIAAGRNDWGIYFRFGEVF
jgi:hypothetical protein